MTHILGRQDADLHHEDGSHRETAPSADGSTLERHNRRIQAHLAAHATTDLVTRLDEAKRNVVWLLDHPAGLVDMHGLTYWAGAVERLRETVKAAL